MGMDAAIMVIAASADPSMTSCVVASVKPELLIEGSWVILMIEVTPALITTLGLVGKGAKSESLQYTHAHGHHHAELLLLVHGKRPYNLPWNERQHNIHSPRVNCNVTNG